MSVAGTVASGRDAWTSRSSFVTSEQRDILRAYRDIRIERVKEAVLSEVSATVARLVREDYERILATESRRSAIARRKTTSKKTSR